jgi:hypothetical protein
MSKNRFPRHNIAPFTSTRIVVGMGIFIRAHILDARSMTVRLSLLVAKPSFA